MTRVLCARLLENVVRCDTFIREHVGAANALPGRDSIQAQEFILAEIEFTQERGLQALIRGGGQPSSVEPGLLGVPH